MAGSVSRARSHWRTYENYLIQDCAYSQETLWFLHGEVLKAPDTRVYMYYAILGVASRPAPIESWRFRMAAPWRLLLLSHVVRLPDYVVCVRLIKPSTTISRRSSDSFYNMALYCFANVSSGAPLNL